jgi:hypothetical protein
MITCDVEKYKPRSNNVLPDPSFPQISESSPRGKFRDRSTRMNLCRGVFAAEGALVELLLASERSCGQVTVADWKATIWDWDSKGGTVDTSAPFKYFSIRRNETKDCSIVKNVSGRAFRANFISANTVAKIG